MGPLQLVSHVYKKRHAGEHETHWVNTSIDLSRSRNCIMNCYWIIGIYGIRDIQCQI